MESFLLLSHLDILIKGAMTLISDIAFKFDVDCQCHLSQGDVAARRELCHSVAHIYLLGRIGNHFVLSKCSHISFF